MKRPGILIGARVLFPILTIAMLGLGGCSSGGGGATSSITPVVPATDFGTWLVPDQREDGTPLNPITEIQGYRVYYGPEPGDYRRDLEITNSATSTIVLGDQIRNRLNELGLVVPVGTHFVVTAVDQDGRESLFSTEVVAN